MASILFYMITENILWNLRRWWFVFTFLREKKRGKVSQLAYSDPTSGYEPAITVYEIMQFSIKKESDL